MNTAVARPRNRIISMTTLLILMIGLISFDWTTFKMKLNQYLLVCIYNLLFIAFFTFYPWPLNTLIKKSMNTNVATPRNMIIISFDWTTFNMKLNQTLLACIYTLLFIAVFFVSFYPWPLNT